MDRQKGQNIFGDALHAKKGIQYFWRDLMYKRGPSQERHSYILGPSSRRGLDILTTHRDSRSVSQAMSWAVTSATSGGGGRGGGNVNCSLLISDWSGKYYEKDIFLYHFFDSRQESYMEPLKFVPEE